MSDIFISDKREDQRIARKLADALESEGWTVWWDPKLRAGERFNDVIEKALNEAKCVIVLWSKRSVESLYVKDEATHALKRKKLVPVTIEEVELPFRFEELHTPSLFGWDGSKDFSEFRRLVDDISTILGASPTVSQAGVSHEVEKERFPEKERQRWRTYGPVAAVVSVVLVIFSFLLWWPKPQGVPIKKAEVHKEPIKEAPIVKPQPPPKETVTSAPEKRLEAQKEIIRHPPVVKVQPETRSEITPQKKAEGQREIPSQTREKEPKQEKLAIQTGRTGESPSNAQVSALRTRGQIAGRWEGRYQCQGDEIGFSLDITNEDGNHVAAIFEFFPLPETVSFPRGSFRMVGDYNRNDGNLRLQSTAWIQRPLGFQSHNLEGQIEASGTTISGRVLTAGCAHFMLTRK